MSGLREQKKQKVRTDILKISKKSFIEIGYDKTSTKDIARKAGIGAGTLFNYFPTKAEILLAILSEEKDSGPENSKTALSGDETVADLVFGFLIKSISPALTMPRSITKEFVIAGLELGKKKNGLIEKVIDQDMSLLSALADHLLLLKKSGRLSEELNITLISRLVFGAMFFELSIYLFDERYSKEEMLENLKTSISVLLE